MDLARRPKRNARADPLIFDAEQTSAVWIVEPNRLACDVPCTRTTTRPANPESQLMGPAPFAKRLRALVVGVDPSDRTTLLAGLNGSSIEWASDLAEAVRACAVQTFDVFVIAHAGAGMGSPSPLLAFSPRSCVVMIGSGGEDTGMVDAPDIGGAIVARLRRPLSMPDVVTAVRAVEGAIRAAELDRQDRKRGEKQATSLLQCVGLRQPVELARQIAATRTPVLIVGGRGSATRQLACAIHSWSDRAAHQLQVLRGGRHSERTTEERWFGQAAEAIGAAPPDTVGRLDYSHGATLLLEEFTRLPAALQLKFERLLHDGQYERRDDFTTRSVDVRILATSSIDPQQAVAAGRLRPELLRALEVVRLDLPPLRERRADIQPLLQSNLARLSRQRGGPLLRLSPEALQVLHDYDWPGNERELCNTMERAVLLCNGEVIDLPHLAQQFAVSPRRPAYTPGDLVPLQTIEDLHVRGVVAATATIKHAAQVLGINYSTLWRRLRKQPTALPLRLGPTKTHSEQQR